MDPLRASHGSESGGNPTQDSALAEDDNEQSALEDEGLKIVIKAAKEDTSESKEERETKLVVVLIEELAATEEQKGLG